MKITKLVPNDLAFFDQIVIECELSNANMGANIFTEGAIELIFNVNGTYGYAKTSATAA